MKLQRKSLYIKGKRNAFKSLYIKACPKRAKAFIYIYIKGKLILKSLYTKGKTFKGPIGPTEYKVFKGAYIKGASCPPGIAP
jgi:hypothetical protein